MKMDQNKHLFVSKESRRKRSQERKEHVDTTLNSIKRNGLMLKETNFT